MIYLDNAATTPVCAAAREELNRILDSGWGNPSALHGRGQAAARELENAKTKLLTLADGRDGYNLIFTGGGTESNNFALQGVADKHRGGRIILSAAEHSSVAACAAHLKNKGFEVVQVPYGGSDEAFLASLCAALTDDTFLVSVMSVNNETGLAYPIPEAVKAVKSRCPAAIFHTDAVQAFGKTEFSLRQTGVDLACVGSHKLHAPVGVGGLFIREGVKLTPRFYGGHQQGDLRPGTEPLELICAFAAAAEYMCGKLAQNRAAAGAFRRALTENSPPQVKFHLPGNGSPFITSLALPNIPSEVLMRFLEENGFQVSAGAACSKGRTSAAAKDLIGADSGYTVRVSVGADANSGDGKALAEALRAACSRFKLQIRKG